MCHLGFIMNIVFDLVKYQTYNSLIQDHLQTAYAEISKINKIITIAESENAIALDSFKNEEIVLLNPIDITKYPIQYDKNEYSFPVCHQININSLKVQKNKIIQKQAKNRLKNVATFLGYNLLTAS